MVKDPIADRISFYAYIWNQVIDSKYLKLSYTILVIHIKDASVVTFFFGNGRSIVFVTLLMLSVASVF